jgi:glucosamine--fructose-6-phosphate aminotransferase (isomerizing)
VELPRDLPAWAMPALYLPPLQLMAYHRSYAKGLDPDRPRNLDAVVYLDPKTLV